MTFEEYTQGVLRTARMGKGWELETCVRALGLVGEVGEFLAVETEDEAGDVLWYTAALADAFQIKLEWPILSRSRMAARHMLREATFHTAEAVKKHIGHGKNKRAEISYGLVDILASLNVLVPDGATLETVAVHNLDKLKARYPDGFTVQP